MFKTLIRLLTKPVYCDPRTPNDEPPDYLTLRELADLPPWHPSTEEKR